MLKKILASTLTTAMLCTIIPISSSAADTVTVDISAASFRPGFNVTAAVKVNNEAAENATVKFYSCTLTKDAADETEVEKNADGTYTLKNDDGGKFIKAIAEVDGTTAETAYYKVAKASSQHDYTVSGDNLYKTDGWGGIASLALTERPETNSFKVDGKDFSIAAYNKADNTAYVVANDLYGLAVPYNESVKSDFADSTLYSYHCKPLLTDTSRGFPKSVADYVKRDAVWVTEGDNDTVCTLSIGLLSQEEIINYSVISKRINAKAGGNYWLRTRVNPATDDKDQTYVAASGNINGVLQMSAYYKVRPSFYLNLDFFKSVKVTDYGDEIRSVLARANTDEELLILGYTEEEVKDIRAEWSIDTNNYLKNGWMPTVPENGVYKYTNQAPGFNRFEYSYTYNEKTMSPGFSVLDYTDQGVLVAADDLWGFSIGHSSGTAFDGNAYEDDIRFDESNLGKWTLQLIYKNNAALNKSTVQMDDVLKNNIVSEAKWNVEGRNGNMQYDYTVTAPISLMSVTDMVKYSGRYGGEASDKFYSGSGNSEKKYYLRTPSQNSQQVAATVGGKSVTLKNMAGVSYVLFGHNTYADGSISGVVEAGSYFSVRPCFYLKPDFFKTAKLTNAGDEIKAYIAGLNTDEELSDIGYTDDEVKDIASYRKTISAVTENIEANGNNIKTASSVLNSGTNEDGYVNIAAVYAQDGALKDVKLISVSNCKNGLTRVTNSFDLENEIAENDSIKIFNFKDMDSIMPIGKLYEK